MKKRSFYAIMILSVALILMSILCIMVQREQSELRQAIDTCRFLYDQPDSR